MAPSLFTVAIILAVSSAVPSLARAQIAQPRPGPRSELFTGVEMTGNSDSAYLGGGTAFGKSLWAPGWQARAIGSLGRYNYNGTLSTAGAGSHSQKFDGRDSFLAALAGYQFQRGRATLKLFAGIETQDQDIHPFDPNNKVQGSGVGLLLQAEAWLAIGRRGFASFDASYGSIFQDYWSLARVGWTLRPHIAIGIEGGALGNSEYNAGRGGGFVRVTLGPTQITLSSGVTGDYLSGKDSGYLAVDVYRAF